MACLADVDTVMVGKLNYAIDTQNKQAAVVAYRINGISQYSGDIIIPEKIDIGSSQYTVTRLDAEAFFESHRLFSVVIPETVDSLGIGCFQGCDSLNSVNIPSKITCLPVCIFDDCSSLQSITLPAGLIYLRASCFGGSAINTINILSPKPLDLRMSPFDGDYFFSVLIKVPDVDAYKNSPDWQYYRYISKIGDDNEAHLIEQDGHHYVIFKFNGKYEATARYALDKLLDPEDFGSRFTEKSFTVPDHVSYKGDAYSVVSLGADCFSDEHLSTITIPEGVENIGECCFGWDSTELDSIILPKSTKRIVYGWFPRKLICKASVPPTLVKEMSYYQQDESGKWFLSSVFWENSNEKTVNAYVPRVEEYMAMPVWRDVAQIYPLDGKAIESNGNRYLVSPNENYAVIDTVNQSGDIILPTTVSLNGKNYPIIGFSKNCLSENISVTSVSIPYTVDFLPEGCFKGCTRLNHISFPEDVADAKALSAPTRAETSTKSNIKWFGRDCFNGCTNLQSITIPESVDSILSNCFTGCVGLKCMKSLSNIPPVANNAFDSNVTANCTLFVPNIANYKNAQGWKDFNNVQDISNFSSINNLYSDNVTARLNNGILTIKGLRNNEGVSVYDLNGKLLGTSKALNGQAILMTTNNFVLVRINKKVIKVVGE